MGNVIELVRYYSDSDALTVELAVQNILFMSRTVHPTLDYHPGDPLQRIVVL